jgi:hypothetical protein
VTPRFVLRVVDASGRPGEALVPVVDLIEARVYVAAHSWDVSLAEVVQPGDEAGPTLLLSEYSPGLGWSYHPRSLFDEVSP